MANPFMIFYLFIFYLPESNEMNLSSYGADLNNCIINTYVCLLLFHCTCFNFENSVYMYVQFKKKYLKTPQNSL